MQSLHFTSKVIKGKQRGKNLGFPTINLVIPEDFPLQRGIYACWVKIPGKPNKKYIGALHYGPIPVFDQKQPSLEVHLLDYQEQKTPEKLSIKVVKFLREVKFFESPKKLTKQIEKDIAKIRQILLFILSHETTSDEGRNKT